MTVAIVLLAAGRSHRFGAPKLAANLGGQPVWSYAATTISQLPLALRITVIAPDGPDLSGYGFDCIALEPPGAPMSHSIAIGVKRAIAVGADSVLITLADMPFVPLYHFEALLARFNGSGIGTHAGGRAMPPALFGRSLFPTLLELQGDTGARALLQTLPGIELAPNLALDIDTPADLERAMRLSNGATFKNKE